MINGVDSVIEVMQKMANEYIDQEPSKYINKVTNSYRNLLEACLLYTSDAADE